MKKGLILLLLAFSLSVNANAGTDGQNDLSKNPNGEVKDCFEGINRGVFAFNQALDQLIIEPVAKGYRFLPSPIRSGTSNFLSNLSLVVTIPNNLLQGEMGLAGKNSARFVVNSTVGILGLFDPASKMGLNSYEKEDYGQTLGVWGAGYLPGDGVFKGAVPRVDISKPKGQGPKEDEQDAGCEEGGFDSLFAFQAK